MRAKKKKPENTFSSPIENLDLILIGSLHQVKIPRARDRSIRYIRVDQTRKPGCSFKHIARRHTTCNCRVKRGLQILMIEVLHGNVK